MESVSTPRHTQPHSSRAKLESASRDTKEAGNFDFPVASSLNGKGRGGRG